MSKKDRVRVERIADILHRAANGGLNHAGRKAPLGEYKETMRTVRDELLSLSQQQEGSER